MDIVTPEDYRAALIDIARDEPHTMARARRVVTDPTLACAVGLQERQASWDLLLTARALRQAPAVATGGTAA